MNYHNITKEDMLNGDGIRVVLWVAGCNHHCKNCQNPITWDENGGLLFDQAAEDELFEALDKPHIDGITFSGGDPLFRIIAVKFSDLSKNAEIYSLKKLSGFIRDIYGKKLKTLTELKI